MKKGDLVIIVFLVAVAILLSSCDGGITHLTESEKARMQQPAGWKPSGPSIAGPKTVKSGSVSSHPGIEHQAGTPPGGTFIIVTDEPEEECTEEKAAGTKYINKQLLPGQSLEME